MAQAMGIGSDFKFPAGGIGGSGPSNPVPQNNNSGFEEVNADDDLYS